MGDVHRAIAVGLANELRVFCKSASRTFGPSGGTDWFEWKWDTGVVLVGFSDGRIMVADGEEGLLFAPAIEPRWECDLAHPDLVELVRVAIGR
jgi:hypothetical protein